MTDLTPWITYQWPADGVDPFDPASPEPLWLLSDGSGRWGLGWPAGDLRDFGGQGDFLHRVTMGYRVVEIRERVALVAGGVLVHASPRSATPTWRGQWGMVGHLRTPYIRASTPVPAPTARPRTKPSMRRYASASRSLR